MKTPALLLIVFGILQVHAQSQTLQNVAGLTGYGVAAGAGLTNNNANSFVLFTNNGVSLSVNASGVFTLTNYAAAGLGWTSGTNGGSTNTGNIQTATLNTTGIATMSAIRGVGSYSSLNSGAGVDWQHQGAFSAQRSGGQIGFGSTGIATMDAYIESPSAGNLLGNTNLVLRGLSTATNGFASFASDAGVALVATGITNALGKNAMAYVTATAIAFTIKDSASSTLYTSPVLTATISVQLHPGWSVNAASGLAGTLLPE